MTYAFQTPEKLCFILDLMNGRDLNYHLSQRGTLSEDDVKFYAAEIILGLQHMHERNIVYRDLKVSAIALEKCFELALKFDSINSKPYSHDFCWLKENLYHWIKSFS